MLYLVEYSVDDYSSSSRGYETLHLWREPHDVEGGRGVGCVVIIQEIAELAFNDPDMLQPPASVGGSTAQPGLSFDEAAAEKSEVVMGRSV